MINKKILFISEDYVKNESIVMDNVEVNYFRSAIFEAQNIQFQQLICDNMYEEIVNQYSNYADVAITGSTEPISSYVDAKYLTLIDNYGQEIIKYYTLYNASYSFYAKLANKGVQTQDSDNSTPADFILLEKMRKDWKNKAESYSIQLTKYIIDNIDIYPLYSECYCSTDSSNVSNTNSSSLYLGKEL